VNTVYLNGGPQGGSNEGLKPGTYYFQVTNPSGSVLLSTDPAECRQVIAGTAAGGEVRILGATGSCPHANGTLNNANGSTAVQVAPFSPTTNSGGEYKLWLIAKSVPGSGCSAPTVGSDGRSLSFAANCIKTDNFKVKAGEEICVPGNCLCPDECVTPNTRQLGGMKYYDVNANGVNDAEAGVPDFKLEVTINGTESQEVTVTGGTWGPITVAQGASYLVCEIIPSVGTWEQTGPLSNATSATGEVVDEGGPLAPRCWIGQATANDSGLDFGNVCLGSGNGFTKGYWHNKNGLATIGNGGGIGPLLAYDGQPITLRFQNGDVYVPNIGTLSSFLKTANASNMANMLSAQFAAMLLNVAYKDANADGMIFAPGTDSANGLGYALVSELFEEARLLLADNGNGIILDGHGERARAAAIKDAFDSANNNQNWVQPTACAVTYTTSAP
jgi:hypothetical protein